MPRLQARYRQRQKERRAQLEEAHEATSADLERERAQHNSLRHTNTLLESLLSVRDASVAVLESAQVPGERWAGGCAVGGVGGFGGWGTQVGGWVGGC